MKLSSPEFNEGDEIPEKHGYMQENVNPAFEIEEIPEEAETLALVFQDPDAEEMAGKTWLHWLVWNVPADTEKIEENSSPGVEGTTDFKETGYNGPNPPDGEHEVVFKLYALNEKLELEEGASLEEFQDAVKDSVLEKTVLEAVYPHEHVSRE